MASFDALLSSQTFAAGDKLTIADIVLLASASNMEVLKLETFFLTASGELLYSVGRRRKYVQRISENKGMDGTMPKRDPRSQGA